MSGQKSLHLCEWRVRNTLNTLLFCIFQLAVASGGVVLGDSCVYARHCHKKYMQLADYSPHKATYFLEPSLY